MRCRPVPEAVAELGVRLRGSPLYGGSDAEATPCVQRVSHHHPQLREDTSQRRPSTTCCLWGGASLGVDEHVDRYVPSGLDHAQVRSQDHQIPVQLRPDPCPRANPQPRQFGEQAGVGLQDLTQTSDEKLTLFPEREP